MRGLSRGAKVLVVGLVLALVLGTGAGPAASGPTVRLSVATGGTGGVYFVLGGALAQLISRNLSGVQATAEVTPASADNMLLLQRNRVDIAFTLADTAIDAFKGTGPFAADGQYKTGAIPLRTLTPLYTNYNHLVTIEGTGIRTLADVKGKRVSVGAPGSGTEITAIRILEAAGLDSDRDIRKERLGVAQSADALKDRKIDAFFWSGGLPTSAVLDLAATPGIRVVLVPMDSVVPALQRQYGPVYTRIVIPKVAYGTERDTPTVGVPNLLVSTDRFPADLAYQVVKLVFEKRHDLEAAHPEAQNITLINVQARSALPFHPGAARYFRERGVEGF